MKKPEELAAAFFTSADELKKRSTALKRLMTGVANESTSKETNGLTAKEVKTLEEAAQLLGTLASQYAKAAAIRAKQQEHEAKLAKQIKAAMADNFGKLSSVEDRIALIAAVHSAYLRNGDIVAVRDIDFYFPSCIGSLAHILLGKAKAASVATVVAEAWKTFQDGRGALVAQHRSIIDRLSAPKAA